ncbi:MAG: preprotein translocase subunit SecE [Pseudoxanthomonas sp.]
MNSKVENQQGASGADIAKYAVAALLAVAGLVVWFWLPGHAAQLGSWAGPLRGLAVVAGLVLGAVVFLSTGKGRETREFLSESRFELRKVVWPTRQETTRMTWVVVVVVIILSLLLAGFDLVIKSAIEWFLSSGRGA